MTSTDVDPRSLDLPEGLEFHQRLGLMASTMVARQIDQHLVLPRPTRPFATCTFDQMSGNTMLAMHLAAFGPDTVKCNHRHLDETVAFIVSGHGYSEFRQSDDAEAIRVDWQAGDLIVIPNNAWHQHINLEEQSDVRQLSFRNIRLMNEILHGGDGVYDARENVYHSAARFTNRFNDQPGYFRTREHVGPGRVRANFVSQIVDEPLPADDPGFGVGVATQHYLMGGQRTIDIALTRIRPGGYLRPHKPLIEEAFVVLRGGGRTDVWDDRGHRASVEWSAGDLVSPPLGIWRQHVATDETRLLVGRVIAVTRALGTTDLGDLDAGVPDRFPSIVEAGDPHDERA